MKVDFRNQIHESDLTNLLDSQATQSERVLPYIERKMKSSNNYLGKGGKEIFLAMKNEVSEAREEGSQTEVEIVYRGDNPVGYIYYIKRKKPNGSYNVWVKAIHIVPEESLTVYPELMKKVIPPYIKDVSDVLVDTYISDERLNDTLYKDGYRVRQTVMTREIQDQRKNSDPTSTNTFLKVRKYTKADRKSLKELHEAKHRKMDRTDSVSSKYKELFKAKGQEFTGIFARQDFIDNDFIELLDRQKKNDSYIAVLVRDDGQGVKKVVNYLLFNVKPNNLLEIELTCSPIEGIDDLIKEGEKWFRNRQKSKSEAGNLFVEVEVLNEAEQKFCIKMGFEPISQVNFKVFSI